MATAGASGWSRSSSASGQANRSTSRPKPAGASIRKRAEGYKRENLTACIDRSLTNLETDTIDLLQLHCPPRDVYDRPEMFGVLDDLVAAGKLRSLRRERRDGRRSARGASSTRTCRASRSSSTCSVRKPAERFFAEAHERQVGILARVPLASGLLTGNLTRESQFAADDHRNFNRHGELFDVGETFSGVPLDAAFAAVDELKPLVPPGATLTQFALRWTLMFDAVTCAIPGARTVAQAVENAGAANLPSIPDETMAAVEQIYDTHVRQHVHAKW